MKLDLLRDLLDAQLVDEDGTKMGRVDGVVLEVRDDAPPVVDHLQLGGVVLARRVHPVAEKAVEWFRRKFPVRRNAVQLIRWPMVGEITPQHVKVAFDANGTEAFDWEVWLRDHIVAKLPKAKKHE